MQAIPDSDKGFSVLQPGSSVATALSEGEAKNKHVVILEIMGDQWRTFKFPLRTVRPFAFDQARTPLMCSRDSHGNSCVIVWSLHLCYLGELIEGYYKVTA